MNHKGNAVTDAVIDALETGGLLVGDGEKPSSAGWQGTPGQSKFVGYVVVHPIPGGVTDGDLDDSDVDAFPIYQFSAYGATRGQCEWQADEAREVILGSSLALTGRKVLQVRVDMLGGARREDVGQPPIWQAVDRYRLYVAAA